MRLTTRVLAAAAAAAVAGIAVVGPASAGVDPRLNHTSYWENEYGVTCTKVELADGVKSWTIEQGSGFYVFKAGTSSTMELMGFEPWVYTSTKSISHVITCNGSYGS
ncbi:hypothetical protein [uncultured Phycicoccus sp.]|uniref:hypothetical protein n=1 Tax=uncultured Phycicoccus sp. TaxID=661422 RepID=UPI002603912C|nr:hypothetical protein [uncultured Phycicoccus sp.]